MIYRHSHFKKAWDFLGSRNFSVFIFVMAISYSLLLLIFALAVPVWWVDNIAALLPFKVLYVLFFLNLIICEIKWIPVVLKRCRKPQRPNKESDLDRFRHKITIRGSSVDLPILIKRLKLRGYSVKKAGNKIKRQGVGSAAMLEPSLYAYKGRFSHLGNIVFHLGFLLLLCGVGLNLFFSFEGAASLMEGEEFTGSRGEYTTATTLYYPIGMEFRVENISPRYWEDKMLFTDLWADVKYPDRGKVKKGRIRLAQPLRINGAQITLSGMGFNPEYRLRDKTGVEIDTAFIRLNIFPPGNEDNFKIPGYPHTIFVSFYPDYEEKDGVIASRSMNPVNPVYLVKIFRNMIPSYVGILKPGEEVYYDGLKLSFPNFKYWGTFKIVKKDGNLFVWIAFVFFVTGLVWRLIFYKRELAVFINGHDVSVYGSSDLYQSLFNSHLKRICESIN